MFCTQYPCVSGTTRPVIDAMAASHVLLAMLVAFSVAALVHGEYRKQHPAPSLPMLLLLLQHLKIPPEILKFIPTLPHKHAAKRSFNDYAGKEESTNKLEGLTKALSASGDVLLQAKTQKSFDRVAVGKAVTGGWMKLRQAADSRRAYASRTAAEATSPNGGRKLLTGVGQFTTICVWGWVRGEGRGRGAGGG